ncbi:MAG: hypothetical protein U9R53_06180 [Chloroflexota bacterium]|nr:hypothetical protein [Chloroflexota bacterium]
MNKKFLWTFVIFIAASLACCLPFVGSSDEASSGNTEDLTDSDGGMPGMDTDTYEMIVENAALLDPVSLSPVQRQILNVKGSPNRFTIMFSDELREETWYYDHLGYQVTLRNGEVYTESDDGTPVDAVDFVSVYYPWQFNGQMGLSELLAVSETESFAVESLEETFQEDLSLVYLQGLDAGFRGDRILYIRSIPIGAGARDIPITEEVTEVPDQPASATGLTAIEQAHVGTHVYQMTCTFSDGSSLSEVDEITWQFSEEGVIADESEPAPKIAENYYGRDDGSDEFFYLFSMDTIIWSGSMSGPDEEGNDITITFSCTLIQE